MTEKPERNFKGVWIPKEVWLSTSLTLQEKVLLVEIDSLDQGEKGCYANNRYFADFFQLSQSRVSEVISSLEKKGFLFIRRFSNGTHKEGRSISVNRIKISSHSPSVSQNTPSESRTDPSVNKTHPSGNAEDNNTSNNTVSNPVKQYSAHDKKPVEISFETFWTAGMRKANKKKALQTFTSIVKKQNLDAEQFANKLADDIRKRIAAKQMGFDAMHPTSYLNGERWEDEIVNSSAVTPYSGNAIASQGQSQSERDAINQAAFDSLFNDDDFDGVTIDV